MLLTLAVNCLSYKLDQYKELTKTDSQISSSSSSSSSILSSKLNQLDKLNEPYNGLPIVTDKDMIMANNTLGHNTGETQKIGYLSSGKNRLD